MGDVQTSARRRQAKRELLRLEYGERLERFRLLLWTLAVLCALAAAIDLLMEWRGGMDLTILTCDTCGGKSAACGIEPSRGKTRAELLEEIRSKRRVFEICRFCGKRSNLRVEPLVNRSKHLLLPPPPPEAHPLHQENLPGFSGRQGSTDSRRRLS